MPTELTPTSRSLSMAIEDDGRPTGNGLYTPTTTQAYHYGKRLITWDGKVFKYGASSGACYTGRGNVFFNAIPATGIDYANNIAKAAAIGDTVIYVTNGSTVAQTEDCLVGGQITLKIASGTGDDQLMMRSVTHNTAAGLAATCEIHLDGGLDAALTTSSYSFVMPSPYSSIKYLSTSGGLSFVGPAAAYISATGYFGWFQTYGKCWIAPQAGPGVTAYYRAVYWRHDGSLDIHSNIASSVTDQRAGYIMDNNAAGNGSTVIMLQGDCW